MVSASLRGQELVCVRAVHPSGKSLHVLGEMDLQCNVSVSGDRMDPAVCRRSLRGRTSI